MELLHFYFSHILYQFQLFQYNQDNILEVRSPGLGRPLKKEKDYVRSVGKSIDIKLYKAIDKQKEFTGILKENMEDQIVLTIEDQDITFEKKSIASARLSLDF